VSLLDDSISRLFDDRATIHHGQWVMFEANLGSLFEVSDALLVIP
jgi:hypothetical protein